MIDQGFENIVPEHRSPISERDPNLPHFTYTKEEREKLKSDGLTDTQIDALEVEKTNRMILNQKNKKAA